MFLDNELLNEAKRMIEAMDAKAEEVLPEKLVDIVKFHSKATVASSIASAWVPGAGGTIATAATVGFIWTMYARINDALGISLSDNVLKTIASGFVTNLATGVAISMIGSGLLSFFPGMGTIASTVIIGASMYALALASGYVYFKIMTEVFKKGTDLNNIDEQELKDITTQIAKSDDVSAFMKEAKKSYKSDNK